jgi:hypothetical protein
MMAALKLRAFICSRYSLDYSKQPPHAVSEQAKAKIRQMQTELASADLAGSDASVNVLQQLQGVPRDSLAMLICRVLVPSERAATLQPRAVSPPTVNEQKAGAINIKMLLRRVFPKPGVY